MEKKVINFWNDFQKSTGIYDLNYDSVEMFGDGTVEMADELSSLIVKGIKTATCSLHESYKIENEKIPEKGTVTIILNGLEDPVVVIKTKEVKILPFNKVTAEDAAKEGEGDLSYTFWREGHLKCFEKECEEYGIEFSEEMLVVFEVFETLYSK